jgi:hypothetical protein
MELEQEVKQSEICKEFRAVFDKWATEKKSTLVDKLCITKDVNEMAVIRGEILGIVSLQQFLVGAIENSKVAKAELKEMQQG